MAQFVGAEIDIEGKQVKQFSSFSLSQSIFEHHAFRIVCPAEAIDGTSGTIFNSSKNMIGSSITIKVDAIGNKGTLEFSGVVTQLEAARSSGHAGDIIISGYSPTILLDNGPHCKTWEKKAVKNIAQDVLKHFPQNLLQPKINPSYGETLSYTVQYKETAWQFLSRLCATYGEWLFYDGQKLFLGPPQGKALKLIYGSNLHHFSVSLQVRPATFQMMAYDYMNTEVYDGSTASIAGKEGMNDLSKQTLQKSEQFYATKPKEWHNHFLTNKKQLDDFVNTRAAMQSSNMVQFNGSSGHPGIQVGGIVSVEGKNVFNMGDESYGEYLVTSVRHYCDGEGNYSNDFTAIPSGIKMPPVKIYNEPRSETQSALVTDNNDPKGLGRVRVKFHWMNGSEKSPWIRILAGHAGGGKGMYVIPEIDEEVIVGFEGANPVKPYMIGSVYNSKANNSFANKDNDVKALLQTRSGNKIIFNDKDGSILVEDKGGNKMMIDGKGNISISSKSSIGLSCGSSSISMKSDGTIGISGINITISGENIGSSGSTECVMQSGSASVATKSGGNKAIVSGLDTSVNGDNTVTVSGNSKATLSATGMAVIEGAVVKLN
mgnify:FL=1